MLQSSFLILLLPQLYHWLDSGLVRWVHLAPACGTCGRARQIETDVLLHFDRMNSPMGLPGPTADERLRLETANALYHHACALFKHCAVKGVLATLENTSSSLFWLTTPFLQLLSASERSFHKFSELHGLEERSPNGLGWRQSSKPYPSRMWNAMNSPVI